MSDERNILPDDEWIEWAAGEIKRLQAALRWASKWMTPSIVSRDPEFEQHRPTLEAALAAYHE